MLKQSEAIHAFAFSFHSDTPVRPVPFPVQHLLLLVLLPHLLPLPPPLLQLLQDRAPAPLVPAAMKATLVLSVSDYCLYPTHEQTRDVDYTAHLNFIRAKVYCWSIPSSFLCRSSTANRTLPKSKYGKQNPAQKVCSCEMS